jgi:ActR/RegA family two-component response regulator
MQPRLLIVEDDAPLRDVLTRSLRAEGFAASGVATGGDLFERAVSDGSEVGGLADVPQIATLHGVGYRLG